MFPMHYKIGTRGSLLALTQAGQIKFQLEQLTGDTFELVPIKTQGDQVTDRPLWQLEGSHFFTKELDEALIQGEVDLVIHSYKDLGSVRPAELTLAAITKRTYAHDVLLIKNDFIPKIKNRTELIVGTSSPRRIFNLEKNLAEYLPKGKNVSIKTKILRGNINSRLSKLQDGEYDAIVLALAGLERLALSPESFQELKRLLDGINFMVLPHSIFPTAAAQGALAIECKKERNDDQELLNKLKLINDQKTIEEVKREREAFASYGGGCHLAVGINVRKLSSEKGELFLHCHRGKTPEEKDVHLFKLEGRTLPEIVGPIKTFIGLPQNDKLITKKNIPITLGPKQLHVYVTSRYTIDSIVGATPLSIWAAGSKTMKDLATLGFWVNGTADAIGDEEIKALRNSQALGLMVDFNSPLTILSNDEAKSSIENAEIIPCYKREINEDITVEFKEQIRNADLFYWTSYFQYEAYLANFPEIRDKLHCCGVGKTFDIFRSHGVLIYPMADIDEFKTWN